jgi:pimeloyl-ACP methyl ester carboxylesterase
MPPVTLQVFPGGGHSIHIERGEEVAAAIKAFLEK